MSENKTILTTRRVELWWRKAQAWFATQFAAVMAALPKEASEADVDAIFNEESES